ncbi:hypothetical protein LSAT2_007649 [Lamellibrachia satsuma]|nr:hypothetical protein LSAT2_007649 [Lamellibrachia satsuma]
MEVPPFVSVGPEKLKPGRKRPCNTSFNQVAEQLSLVSAHSRVCWLHQDVSFPNFVSGDQPKSRCNNERGLDHTKVTTTSSLQYYSPISSAAHLSTGDRDDIQVVSNSASHVMSTTRRCCRLAAEKSEVRCKDSLNTSAIGPLDEIDALVGTSTAGAVSGYASVLGEQSTHTVIHVLHYRRLQWYERD